MEDLKFRYYGNIFNDPGLILEKYNEEYFLKELEMESVLFYNLRKTNNIQPYKIIDSSNEEKKEINDFFIKNQDSFFFLFINNDLVGSILILGNYIQCLCVNKKYQRQGYGEKLVKHAVNYIKKNKYEYVELKVMKGNIAAVKLYTKIGFVRVE